MLLCLKKDTTPWTCCCGCTVTCGVIFYTVWQAIYLFFCILTLQAGIIVPAILVDIPLIVMIIKRKSVSARTCMYIWLWVQFGLFLLMMLVLLILIIALTKLLAVGCDDDAECVAKFAVWLYLIWFAILLLGSPLQILWIELFKAFRDQLKHSGIGNEKFVETK